MDVYQAFEVTTPSPRTDYFVEGQPQKKPTNSQKEIGRLLTP